MKILTLDLATNTGWCIIDNGIIADHGSADFKPRRFENQATKFIKFKNFLEDFKDFDLFIFEGVSGNFRRN